MEIITFCSIKNSFSKFLNDILENHPKCVCIIDTNVIGFLNLGSKKEILIIPFEACELNKSREKKIEIEDQILSFSIKKKDAIISIGGGITSDISGFIASTILRGISYYIVPTTLLAMVDASIGGKNGVNTHHGKNLVGSIYFPKKVFIDLEFLTTLPIIEITSGYGEIIKYSLIENGSLLRSILQNDPISHDLVNKCISIKQKIVNLDPRDAHYRKILNLGHTIGHALEHASSYAIAHGIAVFYGCMIEAEFSLTFSKLIPILKRIQVQYNFPLLTSYEFCLKKFSEALLKDKKIDNQSIQIITDTFLKKPHSKEFITEIGLEIILEKLKHTLSHENSNLP